MIFVPVEELFLDWKEARWLLTSFCNDIKDWIIEINESSELNISLEFPMVEDVYGNLIPMLLLFPKKEREKIQTILTEVLLIYIPDLSGFIRELFTDKLKHTILYQIKYKEQFIISNGGRNIKDEIKFKLGIKA